MVEAMKTMATDLLQMVLCMHCSTVALTLQQGTANPMPLLETPGHSQASLGLSLMGSLFLSPGPGVHNVLYVPSKSLFSLSCVSSVIKSHWPPKSNSLGILSPLAKSTSWEICCGF